MQQKGLPYLMRKISADILLSKVLGGEPSKKSLPAYVMRSPGTRKRLGGEVVTQSRVSERLKFSP